MKTYNSVYELVETEEATFQRPIDINGWSWSFKEHIKTSFYYKHGRLLNGNDENTPVKNITRPLLNLQYRAEDIDLKDIVLYVDDPTNYHLSFLIKKYHEDVFALENDLDTFIDEWKESKVDYGIGLCKKGAGAKPEVIDLQSIAFCDQTNIMKGPIAFKHFFNPSELMGMADQGWGNPANGATATIQELIDKSEAARQNDKTQGIENETPGNYIEIYEVHGSLPLSFLSDEGDPTKYKLQMHIIAFYKTNDGKKSGVTLFRKGLKSSMLDVTLRDKIYSRAAGYGGAEELFENQVWTTYSIIRQKELLDAASKVILKSVGAEMKSRYPNGLRGVDNLEIIELGQGEDLAQIDTTPRSLALFDNFEQSLKAHAQETASAFDPILGKESPSGTPFRAQERQVIEGKGLHIYRQGKYAKDLERVYRNWIIPHIIEQVTNGTTFLSELSTDEMQYVADKVVEYEARQYTLDKLFNGEVVTQQQVDFYKEKVRADFVKGGNKKFLEILKGQFKKMPVRIKINIAGKQKDLGFMTDKIVNIFRQIIANPQGFIQVMQIPGMSKQFNDILEYSGLSPIYYAGVTQPQAGTGAQQPAPQTGQGQQGSTESLPTMQLSTTAV